MDLKAEKMKILQMVESGKVTVTEAEMLLDALRGTGGGQETAVSPRFDATALRRFSEEGVSATFIRAASQLPLPNLTAEEILLLWEEDANLDIIRRLSESGLATRLTLPHMIEIASEGTDDALIDALAKLDGWQLTADQLVEIMIERADPAIIEAAARLEPGYLNGEQLVTLAEEKVRGELLDAVATLIAVDFTGDHLVELATERADPERIRAIAAANIPHLTGDQIVEFALEGIDPELLKVWQKLDVYDFA